jgi:RNA polymerase sigma-70 factor (ECF subfamily)
VNTRPRQRDDARADELLAIRCQLGERAAFDELIERYAHRLRGFVRRVANSESEADDLVQDTWLRILRGLPGLRDPKRLRAWLFGIAHRVLIDRLRLRYAEPAHSPIDALADDGDLQADHLRHEQVERGLAALAPPEREAVVLFYLEQLSLAEAAEVMAVPLGTAKSRLHRARTRLRAVLETQDAPRGTGETP